MARMIPPFLSPETESRAEGVVFRSLRDQLGDDFCVFHSFGILDRNLENSLIDREIDFLILSKRRGIVVLEVKGGGIEYDGSKGTWLQNGRPMKMSPFEQAMRNKYAVRDFLVREAGKMNHLTLGHAVCFPDVHGEIPRLPADANPAIIITGDSLSYLKEAVEGIFDGYRRKKDRQLTPKEWDRVRSVLMPQFEMGVSIVDRVNIARRKIFALTQEQCRLLDFLGSRRRVLVRGCAGTGKTCLATRKAQELAASGSSVLLLCYNNPLSRHFEEILKGGPGGITVSTYHSFCLSTLRKAGVELDQRSQSHDFWLERIPEAFFDYLQKHPLRYDAVIVDEGQDFHSTYWITVEELVEPDGHFYIFYDPDQNLYGSELEFPITDEPFVLTTNCRNTRHIGETLLEISDFEMEIRDTAPDGEPVEELTCSSARNVRKALSRIFHRLITEGGMGMEQVVVLGGHKLDHTSLGTDHRVGNFTIEENPAKDASVIRYSTYMRFKGCEADAVILLDVDPTDKRWANPRCLYTAMSRAKFILFVLRKKF